MSSISNVTQTPIMSFESCCNNHKRKIDVTLRTLEKISAVALGLFSALRSLQLFVPFFLVGVGLGMYNFAQNRKVCDLKEPISSCSQSFMEHLTGIKQPPLVSLATNMAVTVCHIDHHASVFVPIIGLSLGTWVGKNASNCGDFSFKKIQAYLEKKI